MASKRIKRILRETGGWTLIATGVATLVIPFPGTSTPLFIAGLAVLAVDRPWAARRLHQVKTKWDQAKGKLRSR